MLNVFFFLFVCVCVQLDMWLQYCYECHDICFISLHGYQTNPNAINLDKPFACKTESNQKNPTDNQLSPPDSKGGGFLTHSHSHHSPDYS